MKMNLMSWAVLLLHQMSVTWKSSFSVKGLKFVFPNHGIVMALRIVKIHLMNRLLVVTKNVHLITSNAIIQNASSNLGYVTVQMIAGINQTKIAGMHVVRVSYNFAITYERILPTSFFLFFIYTGRSVFKCNPGEWKCPGVTERCVNISRVCDGQPDCPNAADEDASCEFGSCDSNKTSCSNGCKVTPLGPLCTCPKGEVLNDTTTCVGKCIFY